MNESLDELLARIATKFVVHFEDIAIDDTPLEILQIDNMQEHLDTLLHTNALRNPLHDLPLWAKVWPCSLVLGRLVRKYDPAGKRLLELGAGCGLVSLIAARYGLSHIDCTDINDDAILFAKANVRKNALEDTIDVFRFDIKNAPIPDTPYDIIAASEILYLPELFDQILRFVDKALAPKGCALFATDYARRQSKFLKKAKKRFTVTEGHIGVKSTNEAGDEERSLYTITILTRS